MDANNEPDVYVMTRAWYGVVPTGAQAAVAIRLLAELSSRDHKVWKLLMWFRLWRNTVVDMGYLQSSLLIMALN